MKTKTLSDKRAPDTGSRRAVEEAIGMKRSRAGTWDEVAKTRRNTVATWDQLHRTKSGSAG